MVPCCFGVTNIAEIAVWPVMLISAALETDSECDIYEAELWKKTM